MTLPMCIEVESFKIGVLGVERGGNVAGMGEWFGKEVVITGVTVTDACCSPQAEKMKIKIVIAVKHRIDL